MYEAKLKEVKEDENDEKEEEGTRGQQELTLKKKKERKGIRKKINRR